MNKVLLLGASGFIGNSILNKGKEDASIDSIIAIEHKKKLVKANEDKIDIISGSIDNCDLAALDCNYIIHAARQSSPKYRIGRFVQSLSGKSKNEILLEGFKMQKKIKKLSYLSGSLMYGNCGKELITESNSLQPISFAMQYIHAEKPFIKLSKTDERIQLIRVPWVFGYGSWFRWFYLDYMHQHQKVPIYGDGKNIMTLIDIEDLASNILYANQYLKDPILNLFMSDYVTQEEFATYISKISGLGINRIPNTQLKNQFENAIVQAFSSNIKLGSSSDSQDKLKSRMKYKTVYEMLQENLPKYLLLHP